VARRALQQVKLSQGQCQLKAWRQRDAYEPQGLRMINSGERSKSPRSSLRRWFDMPAQCPEHSPKRLHELLSAVLTPGYGPSQRALLILNDKLAMKDV